MPRKYDRTIRYYASWFDDLLDPNKAFTPQECWSVILAIRDCQLTGSLQPLEALPIEIKRALSMATMGEQIVRQLERAENMRSRSKKGGDENAKRIREELRQKSIDEANEERAAQERKAVNLSSYIDMLKAAASGDEEAQANLQLTAAAAKTILAKKGVVL